MGSTGTNGELDWAFVPPFTGKYSVEATFSDVCTLPCSFSGISTVGTLESKYQVPIVDTTPPVVTVTTPKDGSTVTTSIVKVTGKVTDNVGVVSLWIGTMKVDFATDGTFSAMINLLQGANTINVIAFDAAGNRFTKIITITNEKPSIEKPSIINITLQPDNPYMTVNGEKQEIDPGRGTVPVIKNGRTLVPIRAIVEALGGTIEWEDKTKTVIIELGSNSIRLQIGNANALVNGENKLIDPQNLKVVPEIINGRTMLPLRFVAENLGCTVDWDGTTKTITITRFAT